MFFNKNEESIKELINHVDPDQPLVQSFRKKSRERIIEKYTWEQIADQYEKLFGDMMNR